MRALKSDSSDHSILAGFSVDGLGLFSDAIFAFSMTLLAVDLRLPDVLSGITLQSELMSLLPRFFSFIITFWIAASYWVGHHRLFALVKRHDRTLIYLNLLFLMFVTLLPFSTSLLGRYSTEQLAVALSAILLSATGIADRKSVV